ncbi:MAG: hypothetical protein A2091_06415 [Desulfuromonadales bacterium GWD2_61_12]|nr:MAG: hypothetical protein A2091_06415 [Desulfuromonadales bacterium GWD2_61_12]OGR32849.1 MAG: hypothetical protein A2005_09445 [Desulfuromonadales bacterium GWC2_61_20]HAD05311.1 hypothetical protein [Desulfuromonas sp.]
MPPDTWHELFGNNAPVVGSLSTSDAAGEINVAIFGSARLLDDGATLVLALGANRTLRNLRQHPGAVFLVARPAATLSQWQGVRLYLRLQRLESDGELFAALLAETERRAGRRAARRLRALAIFHIDSARPLLDLHD